MDKEKLSQYFHQINDICDDIKDLIEDYKNFDKKPVFIFNYNESELIQFITNIDIFADKLLDAINEHNEKIRNS